MNQARMDKILEKDRSHAQRSRHSRKEGLAYSVDKRALLNAVRSEGAEILTEQGASYWKDQERKYPHLNISGRGSDNGQSPDGTRNRFGRVSWRSRFVDGQLVRERNENGKWVPMERGPGKWKAG